ncbi:MAG: helix-turn-helix domain-containing protein, partial [Desulfobacteraceae bacterium]|nr:helix-turn-helix domain-containing protein [Desulfobacteraceae bacterium]
MLKETIAKNKIKLRKDCLTTTELAKLCGVSRFTIINWVNRGKIGTMKTVGGHCRIPVSEAISFYETFHKEKNRVMSESLCHCWEYSQGTNCDRECKSCLLYGSRINYCFVVVRELAKEVLHCKGGCLNCEYFEEFF